MPPNPPESNSQPSPGPPRRSRWWLLLVAAVPVALLAVGVVPKMQRSGEAKALAKEVEDAKPRVAVSRAKTAPSASELLLPGNTEAVTTAAIYARANGYIRERRVDIGTPVRAGQVLAVIESPELDQELQQARHNLTQARAELERTKANLEQARAGLSQAQADLQQSKANEEIAAATHQRWDKLVSRGVLSRQVGDERRSEYAARQAATSASQAAVGTAQAMISSQQANIGAAEAAVSAQAANVQRLARMQAFERVVAPFDGVITERNVERGDLVNAGSGGERSLFGIAQDRILRIQVNVPQAYAVDIQPGQAAEVLVRERPGESYRGTVARTARSLDSASRTLLTEVQVDNKAGRLLPGMYAQVKFTVARSRPAVLVPSDALIVDARGTRVATLTPKSTVHYVPVQVGRDLGSEVEILQGLNGQEQLISNPSDGLTEGEAVEKEGSARAGGGEQGKGGKP